MISLTTTKMATTTMTNNNDRIDNNKSSISLWLTVDVAGSGGRPPTVVGGGMADLSMHPS